MGRLLSLTSEIEGMPARGILACRNLHATRELGGGGPALDEKKTKLGGLSAATPIERPTALPSATHVGQFLKPGGLHACIYTGIHNYMCIYIHIYIHNYTHVHAPYQGPPERLCQVRGQASSDVERSEDEPGDLVGRRMAEVNGPKPWGINDLEKVLTMVHMYTYIYIDR